MSKACQSSSQPNQIGFETLSQKIQWKVTEEDTRYSLLASTGACACVCERAHTHTMMAEVKKKKEEEKEEGEEIAIKVEVKEEVTWHSGARKHLSFCIHSHASHTYTSHHSSPTPDSSP